MTNPSGKGMQSAWTWLVTASGERTTLSARIIACSAGSASALVTRAGTGGLCFAGSRSDSSSDIDALCERVEKAGAKVLDGPLYDPNGRQHEIWLEAPEGYRVVVAGPRDFASGT